MHLSDAMWGNTANEKLPAAVVRSNRSLCPVEDASAACHRPVPECGAGSDDDEKRFSGTWAAIVSEFLLFGVFESSHKADGFFFF